MLSAKEYEINLVQIIEILKNKFSFNNNNIKLENFLNYFIDKYNMKIKTNDFIQITIEVLIIIYNDLDKILLKMWEKADMKRNGVIFFREFEGVMNVFLGSSENKWKITEYFK